MRSVWKWLFARPTSLRFPTDCADASLLGPALESARSDLIREIAVRPGLRGLLEIEVELAPGWDVQRVRAALRAALPPGVELVGGPAGVAGASMMS